MQSLAVEACWLGFDLILESWSSVSTDRSVNLQNRRSKSLRLFDRQDRVQDGSNVEKQPTS